MQESVGSGLTRPLAWRKEQLGRLMTLVEQHEQDVLKALQNDLGKPATEAFFEIVALRQELKFTRRHLRRWMRAKRVPVPVALSPGLPRSVCRAFRTSCSCCSISVISRPNCSFRQNVSPVILSIQQLTRMQESVGSGITRPLALELEAGCPPLGSWHLSCC